MNENVYKTDDLDEINKQIEEEVIAYDPENYQKKPKKEFLSLKFLTMLMIFSLMALSIVKLFV